MNKHKTIRTAKGIKTTYELVYIRGEYSFLVTEKIKGKEPSHYRIDKVTVSHKRAEEIFKKLIKHKVLGCTVCDVIVDLICE